MNEQHALAEKSIAAHYAIYDAKRALNAVPTCNPLYANERGNLDLAFLFLAKAKWYAGRYTGTHIYVTEHTKDEKDASQAEVFFSRVIEIAKNSEELLIAGDASGINQAANRYRDSILLRTKGSEIVFADDTPVVPTVCPIVILRGSSYEMGQQYVRQIVDIFGSWVFERIAAREFKPHDIEVIKKWHEHIEACTPEIAEMVRGWVDAATEIGIGLNYWNAIQLWTGHFSPIWDGYRGHGVRDLVNDNIEQDEERADSAYLGGQSTLVAASDPSVDLCSGCCAWGDATVDGALIVGATTDHDCTFQATIVAFPDTGNSFIYTPFSITGFIPGLGQYYFAGHPGMNNKGLAYVHHGGGLHGIESEDDRGYGLRRGASVFHNLRFADSAKLALRKELSWPIGDVGSILGSVGGFYADVNYAYICEARPSAAAGKTPIIREFSYDEAGRSYSFLYANNNSVHPRSAGGFSAPPQGYEFNPVEGWVCDKPAALAHLGEKQLVPALSTKSSQGRNRYLFNSMKASYGKIDIDVMLEIYSTSAPERFDGEGLRLTHKEREHAWAIGKDWPSSICHRVNAFSAVLKPDNGSNGIYMGCIGPANHRALMHIPGHGYYYYDEVNEFWEIRLRNSPEEIVADASATAERLLARGVAALSSARSSSTTSGYFHDLLLKARTAFAEGTSAVSNVRTAESDRETLESLSRALRRFTTCQVRSKQLWTELSAVDGIPGSAEPDDVHCGDRAEDNRPKH